MQPPKIDPREISDLIAQMRELAPYYTPEWRFTPDNPDPGSALFLMFADMFHDNIKRLNRVPTKNLIAFLNMFDVTLLPARPASSYLTFVLNEGTKESVFISAGTQVAAAMEETILYETARSVLLTPALLTSVYVTSRKQDIIVRIADDFVEASRQGLPAPKQLFALQEGNNIQAHALYVEHSALFTVTHPAQIEIEFRNSTRRFEEFAMSSQLSDPDLTEWLYGTQEGWKPFDHVEAKGNRVILQKLTREELVLKEVNGLEGHWIQCRLKPHSAERKTLAESRLSMDHISVKTDYIDTLDTGGIQPDQMFYNDVDADPSGFYPFGDQFALYGSFYIGSNEVFTKTDGDIKLSFGLQAIENRFGAELTDQVDWKMVMKKTKFEKPPVVHVTVGQVAWEYWNGTTWVRLDVGKEADKLFYYPLEQKVRKEIQFRCPADLQPTYVNGNENRWIRARILQIENAYVAQALYLSPWIDEVSLTYQFEDRLYQADRCLAFNNTVYEDRTKHSRGLAGGFEPFQPLEGAHPALCISFDTAPVKGPISLFISVKQQRFSEHDVPLLEWEYLRTGAVPGSAPEWAALKVIDETNGLTQSGTVQFVGPSDFAAASVFGQHGYWIRASNRDDLYDHVSGHVVIPMIQGLFMNTVHVLQQETITAEIPLVKGLEELEYQLSRQGIVSEEVWVDETDFVTEEEISEYEQSGVPLMDIRRDSEGNVMQVWVRWTAVRDFTESGSRDRHYVIDRTFGRIRVGDGVQGLHPPKGGLEQLKVTYQVTSGQIGNVPARHINGMQDSIAFVGEVYNPEPASGGCEAEKIESALERGPELLKHRNRAVSSKDYEWLAREAYPNIAKVTCIPNRNAYMQKEIGSMTLVILPKEGQQGSSTFPELKKQVERFILGRASSLVAFPERLQVIEPVYMEISVSATVAVEGMDAVVMTEIQAIEKLTRFLDPLTGNFDSKGWAIGQPIHPSVFYALLKSIRTISHVEKLYMTVFKIEDGVRVELDVNRLPSLPHGIIVSGKHKVVVNVL
ncbi:baseplate J/gp47 family protein [Paenibacillus roseipurpureus]|uniref:Baseplate J/gp47 family protein n=1 Tax=Paenibacillus roseopurpureus TaxID=2918901 RepID=A0AA96LQQ4_9BACL|nr:baseplate J/gp47 family protein [Paenibacillus sp. MBLB1832]WNR44083.1 baseplate J/gp47 family protein [Paenibacillus sp. MBLB1832]